MYVCVYKYIYIYIYIYIYMCAPLRGGGVSACGHVELNSVAPETDTH